MKDFNISLSNHSKIRRYAYCKYLRPDTDLEEYAKRSAIVLVIVLGILGNIFAIVLAAKHTDRKNLHHLIINMAVSDALFLLARLLDNFFRWIPEFRKGIIMSGIVLFLYCTTYRVSLVSLLVISIERFRATRRTLARSRPYTLKRRLIVLGICWLIPMPIAAYWTSCTHSLYPRSGPCKLIILAALTENLSLVILCFVVLVLSAITMTRLSRPQAIQAHLNDQQRTRRTRRTQAVVRMVIVSLLLYMFCWLPRYILDALRHLDTSLQAIKILDYSTCIDWNSLYFILHKFLPLVNSLLSPLIYIIFLPDFRQAAKRVLCRRETPNQAPNHQNSVHVVS